MSALRIITLPCVKVKLRFLAPCAGIADRADLIKSVTLCHDAQVMGPYRVSSPLCLTVLAAESEDYTTVPQQIRGKLVYELSK